MWFLILAEPARLESLFAHLRPQKCFMRSIGKVYLRTAIFRVTAELYYSQPSVHAARSCFRAAGPDRRIAIARFYEPSQHPSQGVPVYRRSVHRRSGATAARRSKALVYRRLVSVRWLEPVLLHGQVGNHEEVGRQVRDHHQSSALRLRPLARGLRRKEY